MTWLGKILLLCNLALSLALGAWGLTLYANRVDWSDQTGKDGRPNGELVERLDQIKAGLKQIPLAGEKWEVARSKLSAMENGGKLVLKDKDQKDKEYTVHGRRANEKWYHEELEALRLGEKGKLDQPVKVLVLDDQHRLTFADLDADPLTPRPKLVVNERNPKLRPVDWYNNELKVASDSLIEEEKRLTKAIKDDDALTDQLIGPKGLHQRLTNERAKRLKIMEEQDLVKLPLINTFVESELLLKRMRSLELRLEELQKARAARVAALGGQ
jgi:hypothetical protein